MRNTPSSSSAASAPAKTPCCVKVGLKRGPWTPEEDEVLANYIKKEGEGRWRTLPKRAGLLRCGKSCRLRWMNYLRPSVKRGQIAPDEEDLILRLHRLLGNRWALIAGRIPGRTDNEIKNYWNTHLSKKLISQGIDPRTHKPLNPNSLLSSDVKASSSKAKTVTNPNPNPVPPPPAKAAATKETGNLMMSGDQFNQIGAAATANDGSANIQNSDGSGIRWRSGNNNEEDDELNCGTDDVFSSFLNSLINEDVFPGHQQQHHGGLIAPGALISSSSVQSFGFGTVSWDAAGMSSTSAFSQIDHPKRFNDQTDDQF